jgi:hypothetical protein
VEKDKMTQSVDFKAKYTGDYVRQRVFVPSVRKDGRALKTKFRHSHGCRGASAELGRQGADAVIAGEADVLVFSGGNAVRDIFTFWGLSGMELANKEKTVRERFGGVFDRARDCFAMKSVRHFYTEAEYMKKVALERIREVLPDFDESRIIIENQHAGISPKSGNVAHGIGHLLENEAFRKALLEEGALTVAQHAYNVKLTASAWVAKVGDDVTLVPESVYPFGMDEDNWESTPVRNLVMADAVKVDPENPKGNFQKFPENFSHFDAEAHRERALASLDPVDPV